MCRRSERSDGPPAFRRWEGEAMKEAKRCSDQFHW